MTAVEHGHGMGLSDNRLLGIVAGCAALATFHGAQHAAGEGGASYYTNLLYPVMADGLAVIAFRKSRELDGWRRIVAWLVVIGCAGASGTAQAYVLAAGKTGGAAALAAGVGAFPAVAVLLATIVQSLRSGPHQRASSAGDVARAVDDVAGGTATPASPADPDPEPEAKPAAPPPAAPAPPATPAAPVYEPEPEAVPAGSARDLRGSGSGSPAGSGRTSDELLAGAGLSSGSGSGSAGKSAPVPAAVRAAYEADPTLSGAELGRRAGVSSRQGQNYRRALEAERRSGIRAVPAVAGAHG